MRDRDITTHIFVRLPKDSLDMQKIQRLRQRFLSRLPAEYGIFDTELQQRYPLVGAENEMMKGIGSRWVQQGQLLVPEAVSPDGFVGTYGFYRANFEQYYLSLPDGNVVINYVSNSAAR